MARFQCPIFFENMNNQQLKMVHVQLLKMSRSRYIAILIKSQKDLELVSSLQHWAKTMSEIFFIQHTSFWPSFILIGLRIQKKQA